MTIVMTGAGSGGHITPLLAVAHELHKQKPEAKLVYIGQRGGSLNDIPQQNPAISEVYAVAGGKFRRFHGRGLIQIFDLPVLVSNIKDFFKVTAGFFESRRLLKKLQADVVFIKGGIVGVPVGLAAASLHIPFITHDSDALPGLGHRLIGRWAKLHAVALPKEEYAKYYDLNKTVTVGVPVAAEYELVTDKQQTAYKQAIGLEKYEKILFITGGGNGAKKLNESVAKIVPELLSDDENLAVVHVTGRLHEQEISSLYDSLLTDKNARERVIVKDFLSDLYRYSGAADVIIARAGATNLAEFAVQGKAGVIVPNPLLTGGHQLKNAKLFEASKAALIVSEESAEGDSDALKQAVSNLLNSAQLRQIFAKNIHKFAKTDAAAELAAQILKLTKET